MKNSLDEFLEKRKWEYLHPHQHEVVNFLLGKKFLTNFDFSPLPIFMHLDTRYGSVETERYSYLTERYSKLSDLDKIFCQNYLLKKGPNPEIIPKILSFRGSISLQLIENTFGTKISPDITLDYLQTLTGGNIDYYWPGDATFKEIGLKTFNELGT